MLRERAKKAALRSEQERALDTFENVRNERTKICISWAPDGAKKKKECLSDAEASLMEGNFVCSSP